MHMISSTTDDRTSVAIDLIGDLDETLGEIVAQTFAFLIERGTTHVVLMTKRVSMETVAGIAAIRTAVTNGRASGATIVVEAGSRRIRSAFAAAQVTTVRPATNERLPRIRHVMIARHA